MGSEHSTVDRDAGDRTASGHRASDYRTSEHRASEHRGSEHRASESTTALFVPLDAHTVRATDYCRGPWSPDTLHGGPVVGLLAHTVEQAAADSPMLCSRLTVEMLRPVPLAILETEAVVVKQGRRATLIDAALRAEGVVVARASSQWIAADLAAAPLGGTVPERPDTPSDGRSGGEFEYPMPGFNCDAAELRYVVGSHEAPGPGITWIRLESPLIAGRVNTPLVTVATVSDLAAAAGWDESPGGGSYINPDITLQLTRLPRGGWIAVDARVEHGGNRAALLEAVVFDDHGPIGRVLQSLVEAPSPMARQESQP